MSVCGSPLPQEPTAERREDGSIGKAVRVLRCFKPGVTDLGVSQIARQAGLSKSTVHRICDEFISAGMLVRTESRRYALALSMFEIGNSVSFPTRLRQALSPVLHDLSVLTGETVHMGVLDDTDVVYVDKVRRAPGGHFLTSVGQRIPAHCTAIGKAMLAWDETAKQRLVSAPKLPAYTPHTIEAPKRLAHELNRILSTGVAFDQGERRVGVSCVAAPIRVAGRVVAAISVSCSGNNLATNGPAETQRQLAPVVERVAQAASAVLAKSAPRVAV